VPETQELRNLFYAGKHQELLRRTLDSESGQVPAAHVAYAVGSLALLGRVDEALACGASTPTDRPLAPAESIEVTFFLVVGLCHAGRYVEAERFALRNVCSARGAPLDERAQFFVSQGAALVRYFGGRVRRALFWVKRALSASVAARFNYGRLLALDLWGHALAQLGEISAGLRTLGQAERLASTLGYAGHATSIACSRLAYQNRHGRGDTDLEEALTKVAVDSTDNLYALRSAWLELAFRAAIHGDAQRARECFDHADAQAVPEHDERSRTRLLLTAAILRRLDHSTAAAVARVVEADAAAARAGDRVLRAEVRAWDAALGLAALPPDVQAARSLRRETGSFAAQCLDVLLGGPPLESLTAQGSPLWSVLVRTDLSARERAELALRQGWLGLAVMLLGGEPARRIWLFSDALLADDHGTVVWSTKAPRHALELLRALGEGEQSKAALIQRIWKLARYSPAHHDAVIYTAVARMRRALGPTAEWVRTSALGYALAPGVVVRELDGSEPSTPPEDHREPETGKSTRPRATIESVLAGGDRLSSVELAQQLGVSEATVLRRVRALAEKGVVRKYGAGKNTRYALV
jgi:hypothetical protein